MHCGACCSTMCTTNSSGILSITIPLITTLTNILFQKKKGLLSQVLSYVSTESDTHIVFVLDGSGSISVDDWALMKDGMTTVCEGNSL